MRLFSWLMLVWFFHAGSSLAWAEQVIHATPDTGNYTGFTARAVVYILLVAILVVILLIGAFMVINLGLMSRRPEDRVGTRTPSDLGILKTQLWPQEPPDRAVLPASDEEEEERRRTREQGTEEGGPEAA